jgi:hypothetical protein
VESKGSAFTADCLDLNESSRQLKTSLLIDSARHLAKDTIKIWIELENYKSPTSPKIVNQT